MCVGVCVSVCGRDTKEHSCSGNVHGKSKEGRRDGGMMQRGLPLPLFANHVFPA